MKVKKKQPWLFTKITLFMAVFITIICVVVIGIVYFWSYYYFGHIFEDKVIDQFTEERNLDIGLDNEWILGVTAHHIDVVQAIHGTATAEHIYEEALNQVDRVKAYREKVDDKYILYMIEMDIKNGEKIYKYSIIKDIYKEVFPEITLFIALSSIFIFIVSIKMTRMITRKVYENIDKLRTYADEIAYYNLDAKMNVDSNDQAIVDLSKSFIHMKDRLKEKDDVQQSMLQYISHELKTPIMIISSYTTSAKDNIFPKGDMNTTLDTILVQTKRIHNKVEELLLIAKTNVEDQHFTAQLIDINQLLLNVIRNISYLNSSKKITINIPDDLLIIAYKDELQILFENLINNQIRYSDEVIALRAYVKNNTVCFLFYNDGEMMDFSKKDSLFEPFSKGLAGGHGLGLSICKKIIDIHKGEILLLPVKKGTLFKITLNLNVLDIKTE